MWRGNIMTLIQARIVGEGAPANVWFTGSQDDQSNRDKMEEEEPGVIVDIEYFPEVEIKTYNVHRKTGDFVIGEAGRIDVNNGQTLKVKIISQRRN